MDERFRQLLFAIQQVYQTVDREIRDLQAATGLRCPVGCGSCCESREIEATLLEALPLAVGLFRQNLAEQVMQAIDRKEQQSASGCVLYRPDPAVQDNGRCGHYPLRPLVCRLFGFAARLNKKEVLEFNTCKKIKAQDPPRVRAAQDRIQTGLAVPVFQVSFMRLASLHPDLGFQRLPVNLAFKKALEYCYWKKP